MTLIELLIVIVIIGILASAVLVAATSLVGKSKTRNTQAVLQIVADAVEQFKREQTERPTISQNRDYKKRYGLYPPDELEVFTTVGIPNTALKSLVPGDPTKVKLVPPTFPAQMRFYTDASCPAPGCPNASEHRDLAALILTIELFGSESKAILDRVSDRNRSAGVLTSDGKPAQYLDRNGGGTFDSDDVQIRYVLDDWGIPICYMSERDFVSGASPTTPPSSNHPAWNEASTEIIRLNGGQPLIFSYGPNGKEQTSADISSDEGATFMEDFEPQNPTPENKPHAIDHPMNADNVYLNEQLREKLAKGI